MSDSAPLLKIKLSRSLIGYPVAQRKVAWGLGLRKPDDIVLRPDNPGIRGMVRKIPHLLTVEVVKK